MPTPTLLIATRNPGKIREYRQLLREAPFNLVSLEDVGITAEVEETGTTFHENALLKARSYAALCRGRFQTCPYILADDSGLEVDALGGEPGVRSARYGEKSPQPPFEGLPQNVILRSPSLPVILSEAKNLKSLRVNSATKNLGRGEAGSRSAPPPQTLRLAQGDTGEDPFGARPPFDEGGPGANSDADRVRLLLRKLEGVPWERRTARFRCVIAITAPPGSSLPAEILPSPLYQRVIRGDLALLVGAVAGMIQYSPVGDEGFGYDPVFYLPSFQLTMAQLPLKEKNRISHRADAARKAAALLQQLAFGRRQ
jgi:XTP/dITP diphosphohydrolase